MMSSLVYWQPPQYSYTHTCACVTYIRHVLYGWERITVPYKSTLLSLSMPPRLECFPVLLAYICVVVFQLYGMAVDITAAMLFA